MGRTNPTFRDLLGAMEAEWGDYRRALRRRHRPRFDRLFVYAREHADAAGHLNHPDALAPVLVSIDLEQETRIDELEERIETLEARLGDDGTDGTGATDETDGTDATDETDGTDATDGTDGADGAETDGAWTADAGGTADASGEP